jgi:hypothetical protein
MIDSTKEKIRKLLALAESAKEIGSLHEAEVATQKALHLLWENGLTQSDVTDYKKAELEIKEYEESEWWHGRSYLAHLISALSSVCLCVPLRSSKNRKVIFQVYGRAENIKVLEYLVEVCRRAFEKAAKDTKDAMKKNDGLELNVPSFLKGCVLGLQKKIEQQKASEENAAAINAIVKSEKDTVRQMMLGMMEPNTKLGKFRASAAAERSSFNSGVAVGKNTNLSTALPSQKVASQNLLGA